MRYGSRRIWAWIFGLELLLLLGLAVTEPSVKHVDIFQQFEDGSYDGGRANASAPGVQSSEDEDGVKTEQPSSCVEDVLPSDPLDLHDRLEEESEPPNGTVRNLAQPNLSAMFGQLAGGGFLSPNIFQIGQQVRGQLAAIRNAIQAYVADVVVKFEHARHRAVSAVRGRLDALNSRIRAYFESEFVEYRDVCLPDENRCMRLLHTQVEQYEQRLRANADECHGKLADDLAKRRRQADQARALMDGPFRTLDGCLDRDAGLGRSFLACTGSAVVNVAQGATTALRTFATKMGQLSDGMDRRVDKFEKCVVKRRALLEQNERQVSETVKGCFEKQQSQPENFF